MPRRESDVSSSNDTPAGLACASSLLVLNLQLHSLCSPQSLADVSSSNSQKLMFWFFVQLISQCGSGGYLWRYLLWIFISDYVMDYTLIMSDTGRESYWIECAIMLGVLTLPDCNFLWCLDSGFLGHLDCNTIRDFRPHIFRKTSFVSREALAIGVYIYFVISLSLIAMASNEAVLVENAVSKLYYLPFITIGFSTFLKVHSLVHFHLKPSICEEIFRPDVTHCIVIRIPMISPCRTSDHVWPRVVREKSHIPLHCRTS